MSKPPKSVHLRLRDERALVRLFGAGHPEIEKRADIILSLGEGKSERKVADRLGVSRPTVRKWRDRYLDAGVDSLVKELPRTGRKGIGDATRQAVLNARGSGLTVVIVAKEHGVSAATVSRIWNTT
jgi:transposase-like protein